MKKLVALMGPTASGKTDLAVAWRQQMPVCLLSVDSALVYRDLNIGAGRPDNQTLAAAPHQLIDLRDVWSPYSAADFTHDATQAIDAGWNESTTPVLVGGTMLYFKSLLSGLSELPAADPEIRAQLLERAADLGWAALHSQLNEIDSVAAARIHPNDPQRIQRALEVFELTGKTLTELQQAHSPAPLKAEVLKIIWAPADRLWLHQRIARRFEQMLDAGLVEEVRRFRADSRVHRDLPAMRSVGYRQVWDYLEGEISRSQMVEQALAATRQLAKRQFTWLRRETEAHWFDPQQSDAGARATLLVEKFLARPHN